MSTPGFSPTSGILIADSLPLYRRGLMQVLAQSCASYSLHEAVTGPGLLEAADKLSPTLVIMATSLSDSPTGPTTLLAALRERQPLIAVIVVVDALITPELAILRLLRHNVSGLLLRTASAEEVSETVSTVLQRGRCYSEYALDLLQNQLHHRSSSREANCFSSRQLDVLHLLAADHSNEEIAEYLCISVRTVEYHRSQMLQKTGTRTSLGLVLFAQQHGLLSPTTTPETIRLRSRLPWLAKS